MPNLEIFDVKNLHFDSLCIEEIVFHKSLSNATIICNPDTFAKLQHGSFFNTLRYKFPFVKEVLLQIGEEKTARHILNHHDSHARLIPFAVEKG